MKVFIGTSGWSYYSFKGIFYPEELKSRDWLSFYARHFNAVEINATFYRLPRKSTFEKWYAETPEDFIFSVKASKVITHVKRLKDVKEELSNFLDRVSVLKEKARVLLFQLPPSLKYDKALLEGFFPLLPGEYLNVIEVRHKSFHCEEFFEICRKYNVCLCFSDCGKKYPYAWFEVQTAPFLYVRLHGSPDIYVSNYSKERLKELAAFLKEFQAEELFVFFDNTAKGYAVLNALEFKDLLKVGSFETDF